jgi:hypothetical protein
VKAAIFVLGGSQALAEPLLNRTNASSASSLRSEISTESMIIFGVVD